MIRALITPVIAATAAIWTIWTMTAMPAKAFMGQCSICQVYLQQCCFSPEGCNVVNLQGIVQMAEMANKSVELVSLAQEKIAILSNPAYALKLDVLFDEMTNIEIRMEDTENPCAKKKDKKKRKTVQNRIQNASGIRSQAQAENLNSELKRLSLKTNHARHQQIKHFMKQLSQMAGQNDRRMKRAKDTQQYFAAAARYLMLESGYMAAITVSHAIELDLLAVNSLSTDPKVVQEAAKPSRTTE